MRDSVLAVSVKELFELLSFLLANIRNAVSACGKLFDCPKWTELADVSCQILGESFDHCEGNCNLALGLLVQIPFKLIQGSRTAVASRLGRELHLLR